MSKKFIYILSGFVVGGCVGAVGSYLYLKKEFDKAQKKIESDVADYKKDINNTYKNLMANNMKSTTSKIFREVAPIRRKMLYVSNGGIGKRPGRKCL